MIKSYNENITHIICECAMRPEDIKSTIINESTGMSPEGKQIPIVTIETNLQSFNVENWNKRIYGGDVVMPSIDNDGMIQNDIAKGQWIGEFGHPLELEPRRQMIILPQTSSHRILKYWQAGNLLKAHVRSLPYGYGLAMAANAMDGVPAAFSLRALGGVDLVTRRAKAPLKVITYDYVYRPSHKEAYETGIIQESAGASSNIYIPTKYDMSDIMQECSVYVALQETISRQQAEDYIKDKSINLQIAADLFNVDSFSGTLNESGTHMILKSSDVTAMVPVEHVINYQYADYLTSMKKRR